MPEELTRLLAEEKEEGTEDSDRKVKEDWGDVDEEAWQVPQGGAEGHAGLIRLAVPRRVQVGDVVRGGQLPASFSWFLIFLIVDEPAVGSVREQRPGCTGCRCDAFDLAFSIFGFGPQFRLSRA